VNQIEALRRLRAIAVPVVESRDVAALLQVSSGNATTVLRRLAGAGMIVHLSRGRWLIDTDSDRLLLPELLSAPDPAYVSLQSALSYHGLIEQIPSVIYAVTPGRTRRVDTPRGTISFHRLPPELILGFDFAPGSDAKIATPEKALFDHLYLAPARSRLFAKLPELSIPRGFSWRQLAEYATLVRSPGRRAFVVERINAVRG
jgi:predicted transcriptional regulator of viral defense system